jgi:rhodanese-related sulfurtransferase
MQRSGTISLPVRRITTAELAEWINDPRRPQPFLLDVRERAEFEVSHLPRAHHVAPDAPASTSINRSTLPIVTYCSVGYRSGAFAERLRAAGFTNVVNLEGSIFRWANEGRPLFRDRQQVEMVHPYNRTWGLLLKKKHRAEVGASGL